MRVVTWTDEKGYKHRSAIKDDHDDSMAPKGIPQDPPLVDIIDWEGVKRDLHNALVDRGLMSYEDVIRQQNGVTGAVLHALRARVMALYKERRGRSLVKR